MARRWTVCAALASLCLAALAAPAQARIAKRPLSTGFIGLDASAGTPSAGAFDEARRAGAEILRIHAIWAAISPPVPAAGFDPSNPQDPQYRWTALDAAVRAASARGFEILLTATGAPSWAEGPGRPAGAAPGTWRPDPGLYGAFARALAVRYSGGFPDPLIPGQALPAVRAFQAWNEPNLSNHLTPQWSGATPLSPEIYRSLLNAFHDAVKSVLPDATVVMAGTAPYGDPPGGRRVPPVTFDRHLFCVDGPCPQQARFDVFAHHAINVNGPLQGSASSLDATTPDLRRLRRTLRQGVRAGGVAPPFRKPTWVTEIWWDSNPPDPFGVPLRRHARWTAEAMNVLWRQGARVVIFLQLTDSPPVPSFGESAQSGILFSDGRRKPSFRAFRFPFVARKLTRGRVELWGKPPRSGKVRIQRKMRRGWRTILRLGGSKRAPFVKRVKLRGRPKLRAKSRGVVSFPHRVLRMGAGGR